MEGLFLHISQDVEICNYYQYSGFPFSLDYIVKPWIPAIAKNDKKNRGNDTPGDPYEAK